MEWPTSSAVVSILWREAKRDGERDRAEGDVDLSGVVDVRPTRSLRVAT